MAELKSSSQDSHEVHSGSAYSMNTAAEDMKKQVMAGPLELRVKLHPFLHQVSGTSLMFKFDKGTICKPLLEKEYQFYKHLPESLHRFTPRFRGSITVECEEVDDGTFNFYAVIPAANIQFVFDSLSDSDYPTLSQYHGGDHGITVIDFLQTDEIKLKRNGSVEMDEDSLDCYDDPANKLKTGSRLSKGLGQIMQKSQPEFILMENLVGTLRCPSVLDLKMGVRTYGDDDPEFKKIEKQEKAANSTSKELGVRLHGMQKYNQMTSKFETLDKFDGLQLSQSEFIQTVLYNFLFDGIRLRVELAPVIVDKLKQFHDCVAQQNTYRFYSSSLLIIYDGAQVDIDGVADVRAIDFAHTTSESSAHGFIHEGPDGGYLKGIQSLIEIFSSLHTELQAK